MEKLRLTRTVVCSYGVCPTAADKVCCSVTKPCLTLCDPMGCSPPAFSAPGIFQARILRWVVVSSSRGSSQPRGRKCVSCTSRWILYHCATLGRQSAYGAEFCPTYSLASILTAPVHGNLTLSNNFYSTCWTLSKS